MTEQRTMRLDTDRLRTCSCGKVCKNERGLKIHRTKMGCAPIANLLQRARQLGEEELDREEHHSVQSLQASDEEEEHIDSSEKDTRENATESTEQRRQKVKWPASTEKTSWKRFEDELDQMMEHVLVGKVDNKLHVMSEIIYNFGKKRFGIIEGKRKKPVKENRRVQKIAKMRGDLRRLTAAFKKAPKEEKEALKVLRESIRKELKSLRRAENLRKRRHERQKKRAQFTKDSFQFVRRLLGEKKSGKLQCTKEEANKHIKEMYSDTNCLEELGSCEKLLEPDLPEFEFDSAEPRLQEIRDIVRKARASSAPGPNGVPYKVYKNCPKILLQLWRLMKVIWRKGELCREWLKAEGCFIPKEEEATTLSQFRTISLLNIEGKILLAVLSRRLTSYLLENKYIDIAVQKGGVPGVSGCVEHTSVISQIIKEAHENKGDLAVIWLDLANAYGSVPHQLIQKTLQ
ncbi:uncharacterized protein LOC132756599 [Ruditapes philippinarum]|uniref:uncharacterized protein LOC132756599 n=1 Tax=Ruditapes philippinarum TaxID=129788 RepID=UPI00295C3A17|nr:uncharacterized protein LOC132756599 [Ruditapes philippinarum]